jgi:hypothetical protein
MSRPRFLAEAPTSRGYAVRDPGPLFASYWLEQADGSLDTPGATDMHDFPIPPRPVDETARLATLDQYRILDTPPEEIFDRTTRLAATLFGMPISLISLIDERRQWFNSRYGRVRLARRSNGPIELTVADEGVGRTSSCGDTKASEPCSSMLW